MKAVPSKNEAKKRKRDETQDPIIPESPKRAKVHAQRKFAQGAALNNHSVNSVVKDKVRPPASVSNAGLVLSAKRPNTEDFLTFLCFRRTSILPPKLDFFKDAFKHQPPTCMVNGTQKTLNSSVSSKNPTNESASKQNSKKSEVNKKEQTKVQALRKKYQEQRLAKSNPTNVTKLAQKVKGKNMIRTRSSTVREEKPPPAKALTSLRRKVKVGPVATGLRSGFQRSPPPPLPSKSKYLEKRNKAVEIKNLRSRMKGKVVNQKNTKLSEKTAKAPAKETAPKKSEATKSNLRSPETVATRSKETRGSVKRLEGLSDFSSDDNEPLLAVKKGKAVVKGRKVVNGVREPPRPIVSVKTRSQITETPSPATPARPTRKTKEAAAIYMEMITKKLVSPDKSGDDDRSSVDSFPELPNAKRNEQRESEIKARALALKNSGGIETRLKSSSETKETGRKSSGVVAKKRDLAKKNEAKTETSKRVTREVESRKSVVKEDPPRRLTREKTGKTPPVAMKKPAKEDTTKKMEPPKKMAKEEVRLRSGREEQLRRPVRDDRKSVKEDSAKKIVQEKKERMSGREEAPVKKVTTKEMEKVLVDDFVKKSEPLRKSLREEACKKADSIPKKVQREESKVKEELTKKTGREDGTKNVQLCVTIGEEVKDEVVGKEVMEEMTPVTKKTARDDSPKKKGANEEKITDGSKKGIAKEETTKKVQHEEEPTPGKKAVNKAKDVEVEETPKKIIKEDMKNAKKTEMDDTQRLVKEDIKQVKKTGVEEGNKKVVKEDVKQSKKMDVDEVQKKSVKEDIRQIKKTGVEEAHKKVAKEDVKQSKSMDVDEVQKKSVKEDIRQMKKTVVEEAHKKVVKEDVKQSKSMDVDEVQKKSNKDDIKQLKKTGVEEAHKKMVKEDIKQSKSMDVDEVQKKSNKDDIKQVKKTVVEEAHKKVLKEDVKQSKIMDVDETQKKSVKEDVKQAKGDADDAQKKIVKDVIKQGKKMEADEVQKEAQKKAVKEDIKQTKKTEFDEVLKLVECDVKQSKKMSIEDGQKKTMKEEIKQVKKVDAEDIQKKNAKDDVKQMKMEVDEAQKKLVKEDLKQMKKTETPKAVANELKKVLRDDNREPRTSSDEVVVDGTKNKVQKGESKKVPEGDKAVKNETKKGGENSKVVEVSKKIVNKELNKGDNSIEPTTKKSIEESSKKMDSPKVKERGKEDQSKKVLNNVAKATTSQTQRPKREGENYKMDVEVTVTKVAEVNSSHRPPVKAKKVEEPEAKPKKTPERSGGVKRPSTVPKKNCGPFVQNNTWLPPSGSTSNLVEAPTFYPTEREFQDPLEFFERIRPAAESFGLCRIVPPSTFKPDCKVSDDMRFTAYNQYVHRMFHRWGPNIKEMMAIKKYLATQSISLKQPPWIGGIEVDLPRLYQSVQNCGGLMKVMEKKKWHQVADMMKIPKAAQDRVTKLDDIYCKYLLPYDTLSHDERQKLFDEVERDWMKRQETTNDAAASPVADDESEEEMYIDECEECIVKGRNMALNQFYRIARNTMSMWFRNPEPAPSEVENEFWRHVSERNHHVCVHSGSIDSSGWGYGFPVAKNNSFSRHPWNLKVLTNNSGSVLRSLGPVMGVTVPTLHVGMVFTAFCWYRDPHGLPWVEYLHTGAPKIWYGISDDNSAVFKQALTKLLPRYIKNKKIWLPSDTAMIPPALLVGQGVSLCHTIQKPGQFILVFPRAFTSSICTGYLVSESVYFAQPSWLTTAEQVFRDIQDSCEPTMFSLEKLLFSIATDTRSSVEVLKQVLPMVWHIKQNEIDGRKTLFNLGLKVSERLPLPEQGSNKRKKGGWAQDGEGDYECEVCRTNLSVSLVINSQEEGVLCLPHAIELLTQKRHHLKYCKLMYSYTQEELCDLVEKLEQRIESKSQKKVQGGKSVNSVK